MSWDPVSADRYAQDEHWVQFVKRTQAAVFERAYMDLDYIQYSYDSGIIRSAVRWFEREDYSPFSWGLIKENLCFTPSMIKTVEVRVKWTRDFLIFGDRRNPVVFAFENKHKYLIDKHRFHKSIG